MKQITQEQILIILEELFKLNVPVQSHAKIQKLFTELPETETPKK